MWKMGSDPIFHALHQIAQAVLPNDAHVLRPIPATDLVSMKEHAQKQRRLAFAPKMNQRWTVENLTELMCSKPGDAFGELCEDLKLH